MYIITYTKLNLTVEKILGKHLASICHCKLNDNYYLIESIREEKYK